MSPFNIALGLLSLMILDILYKSNDLIIPPNLSIVFICIYEICHLGPKISFSFLSFCHI